MMFQRLVDALHNKFGIKVMRNTEFQNLKKENENYSHSNKKLEFVARFSQVNGVDLSSVMW
jgi:hypothetical protein